VPVVVIGPDQLADIRDGNRVRVDDDGSVRVEGG
jgi:hypothetical protein